MTTTVFVKMSNVPLPNQIIYKILHINMLKDQIIGILFLFVILLILTDCNINQISLQYNRQPILDSFEVILPEYDIIDDDFKRFLDSALTYIKILEMNKNNIQSRFQHYIQVDFYSSHLTVGVYNSYLFSYDYTIPLKRYPEPAIFTPGFVGYGVNDNIVKIKGYNCYFQIYPKDTTNTNIKGRVFKNLNRDITLRGYGYYNQNIDYWMILRTHELYYEYDFDMDTKIYRRTKKVSYNKAKE